MIHSTEANPESQIETDRISAHTRLGMEAHRIIAEDLEDQADLERERFNAGFNAAVDLCARLASHEGHKALSALIRRQVRKA
jgi:hypothetical protein